MLRRRPRPPSGPTVPRWWHGSSDGRRRPRTAPRRRSGSSTSPSSAAAPISAPRSGPEARSQPIGGPACRNWPGSQAEHLGGRARRRPASPARRARRPAPGRWRRRRSGSAATVARSVLGALHRRAPVDPVDLRGLALDRVGEQVGSDAHDRGSCSVAAPRQLEGPAGGPGVGQVDLGAGLGQRRRPARRRPCGSPRRADAARRRPDALGARRRGSPARARRPGRARRRGRAPRRAGRRRCAGRRRRGRGARAGSSGRSSGAPGPG